MQRCSCYAQSLVCEWWKNTQRRTVKLKGGLAKGKCISWDGLSKGKDYFFVQGALTVEWAFWVLTQPSPMHIYVWGRECIVKLYTWDFIWEIWYQGFVSLCLAWRHISPVWKSYELRRTENICFTICRTNSPHQYLKLCRMNHISPASLLYLFSNLLWQQSSK